MTIAVMALGALAQVVAWWFVASGRAGVWTALGPVLAVAGVLAVAAAPPPLSGRAPVALGAAVGLGSGIVLYLGTRAFASIVASRWAAFTRDAQAIYRHGVGRIAVGAMLAAGAVAVGEELFWRGLAQPELAARLDGAAAGAAAGWLAYVVANAPSRNLAILAGAIVGGAVWSGLAWWSAGVLASLLAHATWTALMLARPVVREGSAA